MGVVKLGNEHQKKLKSLSRAIEVIAKICRIFVYIGIGALLLVLFIIPVAIKNIDANDDAIIVSNYNITVNDNEFSIFDIKQNEFIDVDDNELSDTEALAFHIIRDALNDYSKAEMIVCAEFAIIVLIVSMLLYSFIFKYLEDLFKNIRNEDKPFTMENAQYFKKMAYTLLWVLIITFASGIVYEIIFSYDFSGGVELKDVLVILFLYSMSYIFEYGYNLQGKSKSVIYGESDE